MNILLLQKSSNIIGAIKNVLKEFEACKIELKSSNIGKYSKKIIDQKIKDFEPDILIIDEYYCPDKIEDFSDFLKGCHGISIAIIISSKRKSRFIKKYSQLGISTYISKYSPSKFYNEMFIFLNKEYLKREIEKIIVDIVNFKERV